LDLELFLLWQVEESFALRDDILDEGLVDACVFNIEEADFEQGLPERIEERRFDFEIARKGEVEDWN